MPTYPLHRPTHSYGTHSHSLDIPTHSTVTPNHPPGTPIHSTDTNTHTPGSSTYFPFCEETLVLISLTRLM
uniref:Uncharacterized protein n=1 Tax=Ditylenchus dipsaci TaxID=166011 RepID=A0A915DZP4_9BILA